MDGRTDMGYTRFSHGTLKGWPGHGHGMDTGRTRDSRVMDGNRMDGGCSSEAFFCISLNSFSLVIVKRQFAIHGAAFLRICDKDIKNPAMELGA